MKLLLFLHFSYMFHLSCFSCGACAKFLSLQTDVASNNRRFNVINESLWCSIVSSYTDAHVAGKFTKFLCALALNADFESRISEINKNKLQFSVR